MKTALVPIGLGLQMKQSLCKSRHAQAACAMFWRAEEQRIRWLCVIRRVTPQPGVEIGGGHRRRASWPKL